MLFLFREEEYTEIMILGIGVILYFLGGEFLFTTLRPFGILPLSFFERVPVHSRRYPCAEKGVRLIVLQLKTQGGGNSLFAHTSQTGTRFHSLRHVSNPIL